MKMRNKILNIFPFLFLLENIFGYNGTMILILGKAIRHWLYLFTFISLIAQMIIYMYEHKYPLYSKTKTSYITELNTMDYALFALWVSLIIWMTIIPFLNNVDLTLSKREVFDSICMLFLYFPLSFLIKKRVLSFKIIESIIYYSVFIESLLNILLYIGEKVTPGFITNYFAFLTDIFPSAVIPPIILGHGNTPRVLFTTSILLFVAMFICLKRIYKQPKFIDWIVYITYLISIMATMTKSFWFGFVIAFLVIIVYRFIWKRKSFYVKRISIIALVSIATIIISNFIVFDNSFIIRLDHSFNNSLRVNTTISDLNETRIMMSIDSVPATINYNNSNEEDYRNSLEQEAAIISNNIKIEQTKFLLEKWKQKPLFGFGFGSYCENYIRSQESFFSYEMTLPALMMKEGLIGLSFWVISIALVIYSCFKNHSANYSTLWLFCFLSFGVAIQTNPFIFSFTGFFVLIYFFIRADPKIEAIGGEETC